MWKKVPVQHSKRLPVGIVSVRNGSDRIGFGASTVRTWKLDSYKSADMLVDDAEGIVGIQMQTGSTGDVAARKQEGGMFLTCHSFLKDLNVNPGRYIAHKREQGFFTIDFTNPVSDEWINDKEKHVRSYYD